MEYISQIQKEKLTNLILQAGEQLLQYWPGRTSAQSKGYLEPELKDDGSPVTKADYASNQILVSGLESIFPGDAILSEEIPPSESLSKSKRVWIIDPLDGTRSYMNGNDDFSILVSLCINASPVYGFMLFPARNEFAIGSCGLPSLVNDKQIRVSPTTDLRPKSIYMRNFEYTSSPYFFDEWMDSGCALLSVARGAFDGLILKLTSHRAWDLAAPTIIIEQSGGTVTDEHGKRPVFLGPQLESQYFIASNGLLHDKLLELVLEEQQGASTKNK